MKLKVDISRDKDALLAALIRAPEAMTKHIRVAMKEGMLDITEQARKAHRFTTRSGMLERSMQTKVTRSGFTGEAYLDLGIAPYARRIHEGGGGKRDRLGRRMTNKPDKFLHQAAEAKETQVRDRLNEGIRDGLREAGL